MKVIITNDGKGNDANLVVNIMRNAKRMARDYSDALPGKWRVMVEICKKTPSDKMLAREFLLGVQSYCDYGTECAVAKLNMLRNFHDLPMTGIDDKQALLERIKVRKEEYLKMATSDKVAERRADLMNKVQEALSQLEAPRQLSSEMIGWLHECNLTIYAGGIRVPFTRTVVRNEETVTEAGEIRISFSGSKEYLDLLFALCILEGVKRTMDRDVDKYGQTSLDMSELEKNPYAKMFMEMLNIHED